MPKLPVTVCDDVISEKASCTADQVSLRAATARRLGECDQVGTASDSTSIVGVDSMSVDRVCPSIVDSVCPSMVDQVSPHTTTAMREEGCNQVGTSPANPSSVGVDNGNRVYPSIVDRVCPSTVDRVNLGVVDKLCECGNPLRTISWKKKHRVLAKNGNFTYVSKKMTSLRCLDCPGKNSGFEDTASPSPHSSKGGGALQQKRLGDFWWKK